MGQQCAICGKKPVKGNQYTYRGKAKYLGGVGRKITGGGRRTFRPNRSASSARSTAACSACASASSASAAAASSAPSGASPSRCRASDPYGRAGVPERLHVVDE